MTYKEAQEYIDLAAKSGSVYGLDSIIRLTGKLGNPQDKLKIIHVCGTNGKGSTIAYISTILSESGYKVGRYISPTVVEYLERFQINGTNIDKESFAKLMSKAAQAVSQIVSEGFEKPTAFEIETAIAFMYFLEEKCDFAIIETGMGGEMDATNLINNTLCSVIASISMDHMGFLGNTIGEIAKNKAGIIKPGVPVFFDGSDPKVSEIIKKRAEELQAPCREISKNAFEIQEVTRKHIAFSRANAYDKDVIFQVPMCGCYQEMNAELALEASEYLLAGEEIHMDRWKEALAELHWEGRMERVGAHITVDGAHNPGAMEAFVESVKALDESERGEMVLLFSAVSDKKYDQMIEYLCENLDVKAYVVTQIEDERGVPAEELADVFRRYTDRPVYCKERLEDAVRTAMNERGETGEIYCLGSLYLVGMMKKLLAGGAIDA